MAESGALRVAGLRLVVEGASQFQDELRATSQEIKLSQVEIDKLSAIYGKNDQSAEKLAKKQAELNRQLEAQTKRIQTLKNARDAYAQKENASKATIDKLTLAISKEELAQIQLQTQLKQTTDEIAAQEAATAAAVAAQQEAEASATAQQEAQKAAAHATEQATTSVEDQRSALVRLKDGLRQAAKDADAFGDKYIKAGEKISKAGGKITRDVTLPLVAGLTFAAKEAIDFENAFADVEKTVNASDSEIVNLRNDVLGLSKVLPQTKEEISAVAALGGQFKVPIDNLDEYAKVMLNMGVATSLGATTAAEGMAQFAGIVQMNQADYERLGSTIVALGNNMRTQEGPIMEMGLRLAAAGNQAGMSEAKIMGISAALASLGIEAEAGGSAMSKVILNMDMAAAKGGKSLSAYSKIAGMTAKDFKAQWDSDAAGALTKFISGLQQIEANGGNVALTLDKLGYTEVRTRDALLRAVGAGDMFASAISLANDAWAENNALATEASKKNATFANRLKILGNNVGLTAQRFGETLMPTLEGGLEYASGLVNKFGELDEKQRTMILTTVGLVAAVGPAVKVIGSMTQAVGYLGKAFSFLAGPHGWIIAAVGLVAGLGIAIASIESDAEKMDKSLKGIKMTVDPSSKTAITEAINLGIEAADKLHTIKVAVDADTQQLQEQLEAAFSDGKFTQKEFSAAKKFVDGIVAEDIKTAKEALKLKVDDFRATLNGAVDEMGAPVFSEERKAELTAAVTTETANLIAQLDGYQKDYNALLDQLRKKGISNATEEELANLQQLTELIGNVRIQLQAEQEQAILIAQAYEELAKRGEGGPEAMGQGAGLVTRTAELEAGQAKKDAEAKMAENQKIINASREQGSEIKLSQAELDVLIAENNRLAAEASTGITEAYGKSQKELQAMLDAYAEKYPEAKAEIERWGAIYEALISIGAAQRKIESGEGLSAEDYKAIFTPDIISKYFTGTEMETTSIDKMFETGAPMAVYLDQLVSRLSEEVQKGFDKDAVNPLATVVNSWLENGFLENVDVTKLEGALAGIFQVADLSKRGMDVGQPIVDGAVLGVNNSGASLTKEDFSSLVTYFTGALNDAFGIESPAKSTMPTGKNITAGVAVGIGQGAGELQAAAEKLPGSIEAGLAGLPGVGKTAGQGMMAHLLQGLRNGKPSVLAEARQIAAAIRQMLNDAYSYKPSGNSFDYSLGNGETYTTEEINAKSGLQYSPQASTSSTVQYVDNSPPMIIEKAYINKESDAYALAAAADSLRRRRLAGVGAVPVPG